MLLMHTAIGNGQPGKINLRKERRISRERGGCPAQTGRKIIPDDNSRHIKKEGRNVVCRELRDFPEDHLINNSADQRLDKVPKRSKDRLLVERDKIPPDRQRDKVAIAPDFPEREMEQRLLWRDLGELSRTRSFSSKRLVRIGA